MSELEQVQPNYTEEEVWDLLSEYLEKKHHADIPSIQRGIYADFHRDGSIFLVDECDDEFAILFCYRNLNFNIYGNIIYQLDTQYSEEFTLKDICEYLKKPFPKEKMVFDLTDEETNERNLNIKLASEINKAKSISEVNSKKVRYAAICLLYAFEYERALPLNERYYHLPQLTKDVKNSNFVRVNDVQNTDEIIIISPLKPTLKELSDYLETKKHLAKFFNLNFDDIKNSAERIFDQQYQNFFSRQARLVGSLLVPMRDLESNIVSALNIIDIKKSNADNDFLLIKNEANTIGSIQFNYPNKNNDIFFLTTELKNADTLQKLVPNHPVFACLSVKNLIRTLFELNEQHPESIVIIVLDNDYAKFLYSRDEIIFRKSEISKLAESMTENPSAFNNIGIIYPEINLTTPGPFSSYHDLKLELDPNNLSNILTADINLFIERLESGTHELNQLINTHKEKTVFFKEKHNLHLPELITQAEIKSLQNKNNTPMPYTTKQNSILFQENKQDFMEWFNEPPSPKSIKEFSEFDKKIGLFCQLAPSMSDEEKALTTNILSTQDTSSDEII